MGPTSIPPIVSIISYQSGASFTHSDRTLCGHALQRPGQLGLRIEERLHQFENINQSDTLMSDIFPGNPDHF